MLLTGGAGVRGGEHGPLWHLGHEVDVLDGVSGAGQAVCHLGEEAPQGGVVAVSIGCGQGGRVDQSQGGGDGEGALDLVLTDALSNEVGIVDPDACLFYAEPVPDEGLSWSQLVRSLLPHYASSDERQAGRTLHKRLVRSLDSEPERLLFHVYARRYSQYGFDQAALIPQVWLHYDPRNARSRSGQPVITRQRMDFLLLLSGRRRIVIEVDGVQHYSDDGHPSPKTYAAMVKADRELRLNGYEVYRFGGAELPNQAQAQALLGPFFDELLRKGRRRAEASGDRLHSEAFPLDILKLLTTATAADAPKAVRRRPTKPHML